jgi:eukaryotic-like serine/threonine-protein kinase
VNPEKWEQIKELFGSALEREAAERCTFLRDACGADDALRGELEALLAAYDSEKTVSAEPLPGRSSDAAEAAGTKIGTYQVIRQIGMGGMGVVYLAVRADDTFERKVAIKLVQTGIDAEEILRRFRHERQILATFDHPNIAKLLDGGTTDQGLPYFVMDYVEGMRIGEYCESHKLLISERIRLFRDICSAVQYVHQNLVVHRDLKPSNILVTPEGVPQAPRFRHRQIAQAGDVHQLGRRNPGRVPPDDTRLRQPRTGTRRTGHDGQRCVFARSDPVRTAHLAASVQSQNRLSCGNTARRL